MEKEKGMQGKSPLADLGETGKVTARGRNYVAAPVAGRAGYWH